MCSANGSVSTTERYLGACKKAGAGSLGDGSTGRGTAMKARLAESAKMRASDKACTAYLGPRHARSTPQPGA